MRIEVSRSGGVAGMTRRGVIDTTARDDGEVWVLLAVRACPVPPPATEPRTTEPRTTEPPTTEPPTTEPPSAGPPSTGADGFTWSIRVDTGHTVLTDTVLTDTTLQGPLRELAERTLREGRVRR